jgi:GMP synthase-like glutamine amidotransferase
VKVHYLQHVPFEDLGSMHAHFESKGFQLSATRLYMDELPPATSAFDWLVIMGGPMGVYDQDLFPWLEKEIRYIREAIDEGKLVLGICLGAQLVAASLGAQVSPNARQEIGWFPVTATQEADNSILAGLFTLPTNVFHWHSDTFSLPSGAKLLARSEACQHQAFSLGDRVLGLQFHLETTHETATALIRNCGQGLEVSRFVQGPDELAAEEDRFTEINILMASVLDSMAGAND